MANIHYLLYPLIAITFLSLGALLAPKPLIKTWRKEALTGLVLGFILFILYAGVLILGESWKEVASIVAAALVALVTVYTSSAISSRTRKEENAKKLIMLRSRTLTTMLSELHHLQGLVGQNRYKIETIVGSSNHENNPELASLFDTAMRLPNFQSSVSVTPRLDNIEFPLEFNEIHSIWHRLVIAFNEYKMVCDDFVNYKMKVISPIAVTLTRITKESILDAYGYDKAGHFSSYSIHLPRKCEAADELVRIAIKFIRHHFNDLLIADLRNDCGEAFLAEHSWDKLEIHSEGFDFSRDWSEVRAYYNDQFRQSTL